VDHHPHARATAQRSLRAPLGPHRLPRPARCGSPSQSNASTAACRYCPPRLDGRTAPSPCPTGASTPSPTITPEPSAATARQFTGSDPPTTDCLPGSLLLPQSSSSPARKVRSVPIAGTRHAGRSFHYRADGDPESGVAGGLVRMAHVPSGSRLPRERAAGLWRMTDGSPRCLPGSECHDPASIGHRERVVAGARLP